MKTADLTGPPLAWAVAKALNHPAGRLPPLVARHDDELWYHIWPGGHEVYRPLEWYEGGPIIEREFHAFDHLQSPDRICAIIKRKDMRNGGWDYGYGPTLLIAAMRCLVMAYLGPDVTIPKELL